jgi:hypothetical protein
VLVLLFPVISATDDLHAMRAEMEESPVSKRSIRLASTEKNPIPHPHLQSPPSLLASVAPLPVLTEFPGTFTHSTSLLPARRSLASAGRAPPAPFLA